MEDDDSKLLMGFDYVQTDICECRVDFATENQKYSLTPSTKLIISSKVESDVIHSSRSLTMSKQMSHKRSLGLLSSLAGTLVADARTVVKAKIVNNMLGGYVDMRSLQMNDVSIAILISLYPVTCFSQVLV